MVGLTINLRRCCSSGFCAQPKTAAGKSYREAYHTFYLCIERIKTQAVVITSLARWMHIVRLKFAMEKYQRHHNLTLEMDAQMSLL